LLVSRVVLAGLAVLLGVGCATTAKSQPRPPRGPIFIRIFKESRELEVWAARGERYRLWRTFPICAISGELGPKERRGDEQAPEGFYFVNRGRLNPHSRFHLSFNLGYPNNFDRAHGRTGDFLMVHGSCVSAGCFAMTDRGIEAIYGAVQSSLRRGQRFVRVHVFPFRMTRANMRRHRGSRWIGFWRNLQQGYAHFERFGRPPNVGVDARARRYTFTGEPVCEATGRCETSP
jgi:murein L,D-transpeptidase YafK